MMDHSFPGKAERTREFVLDGMKDIQKAFAEEDLIANVRLETCVLEKDWTLGVAAFWMARLKCFLLLLLSHFFFDLVYSYEGERYFHVPPSTSESK